MQFNALSEIAVSLHKNSIGLAEWRLHSNPLNLTFVLCALCNLGGTAIGTLHAEVVELNFRTSWKFPVEALTLLWPNALLARTVACNALRHAALQTVRRCHSDTREPPGGCLRSLHHRSRSAERSAAHR